MIAATYCQSLSQASLANTPVSLSPVTSYFTQIFSSSSLFHLLNFLASNLILIGELLTFKMLWKKNTSLAFFSCRIKSRNFKVLSVSILAAVVTDMKHSLLHGCRGSVAQSLLEVSHSVFSQIYSCMFYTCC